MKNIQNSFKISGFIGFSEVRAFDSASVCRFSIAVSRQNRGSEKRTTVFVSSEAWRKNDVAENDFKTFQKGNLVTIEGFFKPDEWVDDSGVARNKIVLVATKFYPTEEKESKE